MLQLVFKDLEIYDMRRRLFQPLIYFKPFSFIINYNSFLIMNASNFLTSFLLALCNFPSNSRFFVRRYKNLKNSLALLTLLPAKLPIEISSSISSVILKPSLLREL